MLDLTVAFARVQKGAAGCLMPGWRRPGAHSGGLPDTAASSLPTTLPPSGAERGGAGALGTSAPLR